MTTYTCSDTDCGYEITGVSCGKCGAELEQKNINKDDLNYYPYEKYGLTTERFYDDGNGLFSRK